MNAERRKQIAAIIEAVSGLADQVASIQRDLDSVLADEQDYYDNMPESFQNGEKGERAQEALDALQTAYDDLDNLDLNVIQEQLETASA